MPSSADSRALSQKVLRTKPLGLAAGAPLSFISGPMHALALVQSELSACELALQDLVQSDVAEVPAVAGYLLDAGGKRLRPALTALGARAVGVQGPMARLMCVGELIHLGSLLHDDVVDNATERRGQEAAHRIHGPATTVLTGDFCLARAVLLAAEEGGHACVTGLARAVTEMAEGEVLQMRNAGNLDCSLEDYFEVIDRKSAALIAWCCSAGALATSQAAEAAALDTFGRAVGRAFQVTDDVLDYAEGTGKKTGADLREGKLTLPLLYAIEADPGLKDEVQAGVQSDAQLADWMRRVRASGALEAALADAHAWVDAGIGELGLLGPSAHADGLQVLGRYLVERTR